MTATPGRTAEGDLATDVVLATFRANGLLLAAGQRLAAREGLTAAGWQVVGAVALAGRPVTVPQIARRMGLTRQTVQATINRLRRDGLAEACPNPDHRRSPLIRLTERGRQKYDALDGRQIGWINEVSDGLKIPDLAAATRLLDDLSDRLERMAGADRRGNDETA